MDANAILKIRVHSRLFAVKKHSTENPVESVLWKAMHHKSLLPRDRRRRWPEAGWGGWRWSATEV